MKKVAILTHYHNTTNYGGALQAYALCKVVDGMGYHSEQVDIDCFAECKNLYYKPPKWKEKLFFIRPLFRALKRLKPNRQKKLRNRLKAAFQQFNNEEIPHSKLQYDKNNIAESIKEYDIFVVGSDQVWNPIWYFEPFFLTFVPDCIPKFSYAASISQNVLSKEVKQIYAKNLKDFQAISVRESSAKTLLEDVVSIEVEHVLDPTLLLSREEWDFIANKRQISQRYLFCYFLGNDTKIRALAESFAKKQGLLLVNVKHATAQYHKTDLFFGDVKLEAPSPKDFLSLIKNAEYVFTDSFHATVFSLIYNKQFFVFNRMGHIEMRSRIDSITSLFEVENRFCDEEDKVSLQFIEGIPSIDYSKISEKYLLMKEKSIAFLKENLEKAEKKIVEK